MDEGGDHSEHFGEGCGGGGGGGGKFRRGHNNYYYQRCKI